MSTKPLPLPLDKLSAPARRALAAAGIKSLQQLSRLKESDVAALHGLGPSTLMILRQTLAAHGLSFSAEP